MRVGALATSMTSKVSPQVTLALEEYERIFGSQPYYWAATRCLSVWSVDTRQHWVIVSSKKPRSQGCLPGKQATRCDTRRLGKNLNLERATRVI